ncbi:MAG TPA: dihydroxyacetone kinase phosphoryl donor subunit DhaM [Pseudonocardiaceae bacterium]|jgi:PTS hybrid protein|nr:dihydroxyacetone kinase phosphoryl donor subunit DhaM [Pseudonocardiaceae bacterium]
MSAPTDPPRVGLVIVSHSAKLADGVVDLAGQMAPEVTMIAAGGLPNGQLGTDYDTVLAALHAAEQGSGVVLLYDLGSAMMTAELAVESLDDPDAVLVATAPLVEGAVVAAVAAQGGADLAEVHRTAESAGAEPTPPSASVGPATHTELVLANEVGLHARPAALLARAIAGLDTEVTVGLGDARADASSVLALLELAARAGDRITVSARGPQATEAIARITALVENNFGE